MGCVVVLYLVFEKNINENMFTLIVYYGNELTVSQDTISEYFFMCIILAKKAVHFPYNRESCFFYD